HSVIIESKDQTATSNWADFNVKANTALLGGGVVATRPTEDPLKKDIIKGDRLRIDLTTGVSHVESDPATVVPPPKGPPPSVVKTPALSSSPPATAAPTPTEKVEACPPGRQCLLLFPKKVQEKALDLMKKKAPGADARQ